MAKESEVLREVGLKVTQPRVKILEVMSTSLVHHLSAEDVYKALLVAGEDVGLATVYRVLTQFEQAGLLVRHNFDEGQSVFELAGEGHHDHMVCVHCGKVEEFFDKSIERQQTKVAEQVGFEIEDHSHYLYGRCAECQKGKKKSKP